MKYRLNHGCIGQDNDIASRDNFTEIYETRDQAFAALQNHKRFYEGIGYKVWYYEIKEEPDEPGEADHD